LIIANPHKRFLWGLAGGFAATLLPIFALNFFLLSNTLGNSQLILAASKWQEQTHGTTYAGGVGIATGQRLFKTLRLLDRLPEINTVVLGSSTLMGITQTAFPEKYRIYNFATNTNPLYMVIGEAEFIQKHFHNIKWFVIPLDWALGFLYQNSAPPTIDLSFSTTLQKIKYEGMSVSMLDRMRDAVTYPKIVNLYKIMKSVFLAADKWDSFNENFMSSYGHEYVCPDGTLAKDFDPMFRGICSGYRFDGSATFANRGRVGGNATALIHRSLDSSSQYSKALMLSNGVPSRLLLEQLVDIDKRAKQNGGAVIFILPPLLPGVEAEFTRLLQLNESLANTKRVLTSWAEQNQLTIIDAGQAERFGCSADEFIDAHHAVDTCYRKVLGSYFSGQKQ
jgi:hypothetical protein